MPNLTERDLITRAINGATSTYQGSVLAGNAAPKPRWAILKHLFCCGSTEAANICRHYNLDPDEQIGLDATTTRAH
jgi:hypothetical protein